MGPGGGGTVSSTLTGIYPWGRHGLSERVSVWGVAGYGEGTLTLTPEGQSAIRTGLDLMMGAVGVRGVVMQAPAVGGLGLAVKSDAMGVRTGSASAPGLSSAEAEVTRFRVGLEGSWSVRFAGGGTLIPLVEIGVRHDGGDAETGFGADIGFGITWWDPGRGSSADMRARALLGHGAAGFREHGLSGTLAFDPAPGSARGPRVALTQTVGAASVGGMEALLGRGAVAGLAVEDYGYEPGTHRSELTLGYGLAAFGGRFTATPEVGVGVWNGGRDYRLGWRLARGAWHGDGLDLALEAMRREDDHAVSVSGGAEHTVGVRLNTRF